MADPAPLTLGTAGHIDHGKTALVAALTGHHTDRLPQERERGISIELGYAPLRLASGRQVSVVDVPGHERLVRTMVAGATGIDLFLLVVAADDGVMPQTREHVAVLRALGVRAGVVAVTKADVCDPAPAMAQAAALVPGIQALAVSSRTGAGVDALRVALERAARTLTGRGADGGAIRLHVDRSFTVRGAGTVVTGTLWSGELRRGQAVRILPASGDRALRGRIRGLHVHDLAVSAASAGQRVAVNLTGIRRDQIVRGDVVLGESDDSAATFRVDAALSWVDDDRGEPESGARVQVHHGTRETAARAVGLGARFWQLRLERPLAAVDGDRLVVRRIAPPETLGGGVVVDADPARHGPSPAVTAELARRERAAPGHPLPAADRSTAQGASTAPGGGAAPVATAPEDHPGLGTAAEALEARLRSAGLRPPSDAELDDAAALAELRATGRAVRLGGGLHLHADAAAQARERVVTLARARGGGVTVAELRDELGTSRRYAQALLEHLGAERVLRREGDVHVLRRSWRG